MAHRTPQRTINGVCPVCGQSRISVVLEGSTTFFCAGPNAYCAWWVGQCHRCHRYLESYRDADRKSDEQEWTPVDEEKVEFLFGSPSPTRYFPEADP